jgi:hypothetical protein
MTDAAGRFAVSGLPSGQFTLTASKTPWLTMAYGQATPGRGAGVPVSLSEGQQLTGLTWKLLRGAVITGTVRDDIGRPMRDVPIVLMQYRTVSDRRALTNVTCCVWPLTESDGSYRVTGVIPGDYIVSAIPGGSYVYVPSGPFAGGAEARSIDPAEMQWALRQIADARAEHVSSGPPLPGTPAEPRPSPTVAYARVYYPGTVDEAAAMPLTLRAGEERHGIDFLMKLERTARIEGRIVGPDGETPTSISITKGGATTSGPNVAGTFSMTNLPPGRHTITARAAGPLWGSIDVDVQGQDVLGVVLRLERGVTLAGRVVFESPESGVAPDPARARINVRPPTPLARPQAANADGSFLVAGIDPGSYRLGATLMDAGSGWVLKSATWSGRDIADVPFEVRPGDALTDVVVTFTSRTTELSGRLLDAGGQPAPGFYVAVFPTEPAFWAPGSRRMPMPARAATDGRFSFVGLPPGSYYAVALANADAVDFSDAAVLRQLSATAITVSIADGEKKVLDLKFSVR